MPKEYGRDRRVADFIQRELAEILQFEMKDPRVGMVSVNEVRVSPDLGWADVYVSSLDADTAEARQGLLEALTGAGGWLRSLVAQRTRMRSTPRLRFHWDELPERGAALSRLIDAAVESDRSRDRDGVSDDPSGDGRDGGEETH